MNPKVTFHWDSFEVVRLNWVPTNGGTQFIASLLRIAQTLRSLQQLETR